MLGVDNQHLAESSVAETTTVVSHRKGPVLSQGARTDRVAGFAAISSDQTVVMVAEDSPGAQTSHARVRVDPQEQAQDVRSLDAGCDGSASPSNTPVFDSSRRSVTGIEPVLDIDEFVHEVRAPLASATFALAALGEDPKALVILEDALDHLRDLITTSSRQVNGPTDVQEHLMRAIRLIDGHQRVDVSLTIGEAVFVQAAPVQFRQLVINLVSNALKFSPTTSTVAVTVTAQNGMLEVNVADQGCGLNADDATLIFENGVRGESSNQIDGSGLGLAIARRLARLAGGDVHLTRTGPEGSVFTVSLPVIK